MHSALSELEETRGINKNKLIEAIEMALAAAYKKDYGKRGQIVRAKLDLSDGKMEFSQVKIVVDKDMLKDEDDEDEAIATRHDPEPLSGEALVAEVDKIRWNEEHHILLEDARKIKSDSEVGDEIVFPLDVKDDFGRIAAQTAKQVIIQKVREAEKEATLEEYAGREGDIVTGRVQHIDRGNIFIDLGRAVGMIPRDEQIQSERYRQGERVRAYLYAVEDSPRGINLRLSRSHPKFVAKLFATEAPEIASGTVEIVDIAREAGSRTKIAVRSHDKAIDPVGSCVGQRGVRVATITSELGGEKIDIIEWSEDPSIYIENSLSPASVSEMKIDVDEKHATAIVSDDQFSLAIGRGGQNVRLAAKLTGWRIDIRPQEGSKMAQTSAVAELAQ
ncbi:MAG: transcription termination/antitermination protein NusA [Candidatus Vogelbacteria bacterium CG10_big_fil_rev_8_21_14_0_10_45_14]|uniref:Transcription termination/antitermination protein NusA n=1 Tax=Candidatus Vogelbacteria bacterium CG10_big_fil_rev_8_21_14_0_10_45_14 TaxID=1975042 RepID=A0A2H0RJT9_9BACT|nr:MAG: transcription termination/antitermination protein NusA [Candidatus Vogelbacteria bacterium CG10_big_fil_rev_8_21_14_0_10_45_14]